MNTVNHNKELEVNSFSVNTAFMEMTRIISSEGEAQAGKDFLLIIKGADASISKEEMLKRFYILSEKLSSNNPDVYLSIIKHTDVLDNIYTIHGNEINKKIKNVDYVQDELASVVYFMSHDMPEIVKSLNKENHSFSNDIIFSGSVTSVMLRAIYNHFLENSFKIERNFQKKAKLTGTDYSKDKELYSQALDEHLSSSLYHIKKSLFSEEYMNIVDELRGFVSSVSKVPFSEFSNIAVQVSELKNILSNQPIIESHAVPDTIFEQESSIIEVSEESSCDEFEEISQRLVGITDMLESLVSQSKPDNNYSSENITHSEANQNVEQISNNAIDEILDALDQTVKKLDFEEITEKIDTLINERTSEQDRQIDETAQSVDNDILKGMSEMLERIEQNTNGLVDESEGISSECDSSLSELKEIQASLLRITESLNNPNNEPYSSNNKEATSIDIVVSKIQEGFDDARAETSIVREEIEEIKKSMAEMFEVIKNISMSLNDEIESSRSVRQEIEKKLNSSDKA